MAAGPTFSASGGAVIPSSSAVYDPKTGGSQPLASGPVIPAPSQEQLQARMAAAASAPTLTASTAQPASHGVSAPAPAVITSGPAEQHLATVGTSLNSLHTDAAVQASAKSLAAASAVKPPASGTTTTGDAPAQPDASDLHTQITTLLAGLDTDLSSAEDEASNTTTTDDKGNKVSISQAMDDNQQAEKIAQSKSASDLASIANGTYPLSPSEQQLLSSTISSYQRMIDAQQTANTAYAGKMQETMAGLGIEMSAPTQAAGMMYQIISNGTQKIADLQGKMSLAVSKLQTAFQTEDYKAVQENWKEVSKVFDDRTKVLEQMQKDTNTALKNHQTELINTAKANITALINSGKLDEKQTQDVINNAYKQGTLDEKTRNDLAKSALAWSKANQASQMGNDLVGAQDAIDKDADPMKVRQRFLSKHPTSAAAYDKFFASSTGSGGGLPDGVTTGSSSDGGGFFSGILNRL